MTTENATPEKVRLLIAEALSRDPGEVRLESGLMDDLGAESIDFLDIVFRLEKAFSIKIPRGEMFPEDVLTNQQFVQNGRITPAGMDELKKRMPHMDFTQLEKDPDINKMQFTVDTIVNYMETKVATQ